MRRKASNSYHPCAAISLYIAGGVGVVVYFRKEGRALGEVTKYVVSLFSSFVPT